MLVAGLIGDPVEHSLSPFMHNAAFADAAIDARYELWPTTLADLPQRVATLREAGCLGANVTVPHKQAVLPLLDAVSDIAARIGAVNTIIPRDGALHGDNTDAYGFATSLAEAAGSALPSRAIVVGAGGASRAVLVSLQESGVKEIHLVNRTPERAIGLARELSIPGQPAIVPGSLDDLPSLAAGAGVIVNATSIGWHGDELPFGQDVIGVLPGSAIAIDLTYRATAFLQHAGARGLRTVDGLPMLIHQGARAFELWTGVPAPVALMTEAVLTEQARRAGA